MALTLLYATDLHGSLANYKRLAEQAGKHQPNALVLGGDLLTGNSPAAQKSFIRTRLAPHLRTFHSKHPGIPLYGLLGNDDWQSCEAEFAALEAEDLWRPLHLRAHALLDGYWIAGCSFVPITPFGISDWDRLDLPVSQPPLKRMGPLFSAGGQVIPGSMEELLARKTLAECFASLPGLSDPQRTIYVLHSPPADTALDVTSTGEHVGSRSIRRFIEQHQPPVTLHGHIHESPQMTGKIAATLGRTIALNPGDSSHTMHAVLVGLEKERVEWKVL